MYGGESIYALIPQPVEVPAKPPMHRSRHSGTLPPTYSSFNTVGQAGPGYTNVGGNMGGKANDAVVRSHATFGKEGNARKPTEMLKKGSGIKPVPPAPTEGGFSYSISRKPSVPTAIECAEARRTQAPPTQTKNFITSNAVENILSVPKRPEEPMNWLKKPNYGQVPPYLQKIKGEIMDEYEYIRQMQQAQSEAGPPGMRLLPEEERVTLIDELKRKWDEVNVHYQQTSVLALASLDSIGKVKRKEMLEAQLAQIEKDIEKLSKPTIYVRTDEDN